MGGYAFRTRSQHRAIAVLHISAAVPEGYFYLLLIQRRGDGTFFSTFPKLLDVVISKYLIPKSVPIFNLML